MLFPNFGKGTTVHIRRKYNLLRVPPLPNDVLRAVTSLLTFKLFRYKPKEGESKLETMDCYTVVDIEGLSYLIVAAGAESIITELLMKFGYEVVVTDLLPPSAILKEKMRIDMSRVRKALGSAPRDWQLKFFELIEERRTGQIHTSTGSGKSSAIAAAMYAAPKARKIYTTPSRTALLGQFAECKKLIPEAVLIRSAMDFQRPSKAYFCSTGMLHHAVEARKVFDYAFVDEQHMACTVRLMSPIIALQTHKLFGASANFKDRQDGADKWSEVVFGPRIIHVSYNANVKAKNVVPIHVRWRSTDHIRDMKLNSAYQRKRYGMIYNSKRNEMICDDALRHPREQVLIMVNTVEHALLLQQMLKCPIAHAPITPDRHAELVSLDLLAPDEETLDKIGLARLTDAFRHRAIPLAIATGVWKQAVDFRRLDVLIRADAQQSRIAATQIVGRTSRTAKNKKMGLIYDYEDTFDPAMAEGARKRRKNYAEEGFKQTNYKPGDTEPQST